RYEIAGFHSDPKVPRRLLAWVDVTAGRTTWVDARQSGRVQFDGRIVRGEEPLVRARVRIGGKAARTDDGGRFTLWLAEPFALPSQPRVSARVTAGPLTFELPLPDDAY